MARYLSDTAGARAVLISPAERAYTLFRASVGPRLWLHVALRLSLERVVADRGGRSERFIDVSDLDQTALLGFLAPRPGETVCLQLDRDLIAVSAAAELVERLRNGGARQDGAGDFVIYVITPLAILLCLILLGRRIVS